MTRAQSTAVDNAIEPSDLAVAVDLAQRTLSSTNPIAVRESLRILLRAVEQDAVRRSVDAQFPTVAAFLAEERA
ncbi:hypothetical protein ACFUTV_38760 [Streptomyces sp. NPDC057298]|uniref:hypothetical protein n=1 Tax=Streptomyces sp. NPDC057298 TaxID=3346091 RepID=UPI00362D5607